MNSPGWGNLKGKFRPIAGTVSMQEKLGTEILARKLNDHEEGRNK